MPLILTVVIPLITMAPFYLPDEFAPKGSAKAAKRSFFDRYLASEHTNTAELASFYPYCELIVELVLRRFFDFVQYLTAEECASTCYLLTIASPSAKEHSRAIVSAFLLSAITVTGAAFPGNQKEDRFHRRPARTTFARHSIAVLNRNPSMVSTAALCSSALQP